MDFTIYTYFIYVHTTFIILPNDKLDYVLLKYNSFHPRLNFTHEIENNDFISFMDVKIIKTHYGTTITDWYRKNAYSGRYIHLFSNQTIKNKIAIVKNVVNAAVNLSCESFYMFIIHLIKHTVFQYFLRNLFKHTLTTK